MRRDASRAQDGQFPSATWRKPPISVNSVVFPLPEGPVNSTISPAATSNSTSNRICFRKSPARRRSSAAVRRSRADRLRTSEIAEDGAENSGHRPGLTRRQSTYTNSLLFSRAWHRSTSAAPATGSTNLGIGDGNEGSFPRRARRDRTSLWDFKNAVPANSSSELAGRPYARWIAKRTQPEPAGSVAAPHPRIPRRVLFKNTTRERPGVFDHRSLFMSNSACGAVVVTARQAQLSNVSGRSNVCSWGMAGSASAGCVHATACAFLGRGTIPTVPCCQSPPATRASRGGPPNGENSSGRSRRAARHGGFPRPSAYGGDARRAHWKDRHVRPDRGRAGNQASARIAGTLRRRNDHPMKMLQRPSTGAAFSAPLLPQSFPVGATNSLANQSRSSGPRGGAVLYAEIVGIGQQSRSEVRTATADWP